VKKSRFTEAQIVAILRGADAGTPIAELARRHGLHANTIRLWRDKYGGMQTSDLARLKQLEDESRRKESKKTAGALVSSRSHAECWPKWRTRVTAATHTTMGPLSFELHCEMVGESQNLLDRTVS